MYDLSISYYHSISRHMLYGLCVTPERSRRVVRKVNDRRWPRLFLVTYVQMLQKGMKQNILSLHFYWICKKIQTFKFPKNYKDESRLLFFFFLATTRKKAFQLPAFEVQRKQPHLRWKLGRDTEGRSWITFPAKSERSNCQCCFWVGSVFTTQRKMVGLI